MYKTEDISVIIPTYNRAEDLKETLNSFKKDFSKLNEVIIVDQSPNQDTKKLVKKFGNRKIKYVFSKIPSLTIARNVGIARASKKSKIICFLDDDVTLGKNYFNEVLHVFNDYPDAKAVGAYTDSSKSNPFDRFLKKIFFLGHLETESQARITSAYGNTYPQRLNRIINSQWLPGVNMCYKKEVFDEQKFDENLLGYTIAEDIDFTYRLWKKYPKSLLITPFAKIKHRASTKERLPTKKMVYVNQIDHFYFNLKNLNKNFKQKIIFIWSLTGITLLRTLNLLSLKKINYLKWKYYLQSLFYCVKNTKNIKKGKLREFNN